MSVMDNNELTWLFTHCRAIGMVNKSESGKWEEDIALFTSELSEEVKRLKRENRQHLIELKRAWTSLLEAQSSSGHTELYTAINELASRSKALEVNSLSIRIAELEAENKLLLATEKHAKKTSDKVFEQANYIKKLESQQDKPAAWLYKDNTCIANINPGDELVAKKLGGIALYKRTIINNEN